jgi:hypothetical protein
MAASYGYMSLISLLIEKGADINLSTNVRVN